MRIDAIFLRSKVGRRMLMLFILCALVPIVALAVISFGQVARQLQEQSRMRLAQASKTQAMSIYERLEFLEADMKVSAPRLSEGLGGGILGAPEELAHDLNAQFKGLAVVTGADTYTPLFGRLESLPTLTSAEIRHLASGKTVVSNQSGSDLPPRVFVSRALDPQDPTRGILVGEINTGYLLGVDTLPVQAKLCVLDPSNRVLFCSPSTPLSFYEKVQHKITGSMSGQFEWKDGGQEYVASYWSIFLKPRFFTPKWTVVVNESKNDVLAPMADFRRTFPLVVLLSLWVVLLLSLLQIRRSLVPLEKLREGTQRIARKDFSNPVTVTSGDEFQELAASFNTMASRLGRQFDALTIINEIDRAILSSLDTKEIVHTILTWVPRLLPCDSISLSLIESNPAHTLRTYISMTKPGTENQMITTSLMPEEVQMLREHPENLQINADEALPHFLVPLAEQGIRSFLIVPIFLKEGLSGIMNLGHRLPVAYSSEDLLQARQTADQIAVALSNAELLRELDQLNWGTLTALARAIDAKSHWTSGHSERVTNLAVKIGRTLGLPPKELEILHRGGLLHDIGKIGTPAAVLDKEGKLDQDELRLMRDHVRMGVRILEPIAEFAEVLPIVLHHHEWFDGSGYPDGLAGDAIPLHARIFAVADVFDALHSERPYRPGWDRSRVLDYIQQKTGSQFDPKVVQAFFEVIANETGEPKQEPAYELMPNAW